MLRFYNKKEKEGAEKLNINQLTPFFLSVKDLQGNEEQKIPKKKKVKN